MNINMFLIWLGNPNNCNTALQTAAGVFLLLENYMPFFENVCFGHLLSIFGQYLSMFVNICQYSTPGILAEYVCLDARFTRRIFAHGGEG